MWDVTIRILTCAWFSMIFITCQVMKGKDKEKQTMTSKPVDLESSEATSGGCAGQYVHSHFSTG